MELDEVPFNPVYYLIKRQGSGIPASPLLEPFIFSAQLCVRLYEMESSCSGNVLGFRAQWQHFVFIERMYIIASCSSMTNTQEKKIRKAGKELFDKMDRQCNQKVFLLLLSKISCLTLVFYILAVFWSRFGASSRSEMMTAARPEKSSKWQNH